MKKIYIIDHVDCANCAAKIERKMNAHPQVEEAVLTFSTRQLRITAENPDALIPELQEIGRTVEPDFTVTPREEKSAHSHHHHDDEDDCCCGHDHEHHHHHEDEDACCCGHDHEHHHHEDEDDCCCGHDHEHHHHHEDEDVCCCGHDHHPHEETGARKAVFLMENLECANCAARIEEKINAMPEVQEATITFSTKQLRVTAEDPEALLPEMVELARSVEADVNIRPREERKRSGKGRKVYIIENLDCAHCAAKIESKINAMHEVREATITFSTKQLRVDADDPDSLLPKMVEIARTVEPDVVIRPREERRGSANKKVYIIENLDCAHCAAKIEEKINNLPQVEEATITFSTKQLRVTAKDPDSLLEEMLELARTVEPEVQIHAREEHIGCSGENRDCKVKEKKCEKRKADDRKNALTGILIGAGLFVISEILEHVGLEIPGLTFGICVAAYIILGLGVVRKAVINLMKGNALDENFLMAVASIGAFFVGNFHEAVGVMLFYRVGEFFEEKAVERSRSQIMDAVDLRPEVVNYVDGDDIQVIPAQDAEIGDLLLVRPGDRIPLDGVVVDGESRIDTAPITGEPVPVGVRPGDPVTSGCVNTVGQLTIRVEKELSESMVTRILDSVENAAASKPKIDRFITRFARVYTPVVVGIAVLTAIVPSLITGDWSHWIYTALTFLVMSCPCALVLSVPLAFFAGIGAGSKKGILFKGGTSMEAMKNVSSVIMDKTGTITKGEFKVQKVLGDQKILELCASCEQQSTHPIAVSIVTAAKEKGLTLVRPETLEEVAGQGIRAVIGGQEILCGNEKLMKAKNIAFTDGHTAGTRVLVAVDGKYAGCIVIDDALKEDARSALQKLHKKGVSTVMLTGDAEAAAKAIAAEAGVDEVHAGLLPHQKLEELQKIRAEKGVVMFVGDGINDAPLLAGADVGAAMGSGADAAIEAADVVFMTSEVEASPQALDIAKRTGRIAWSNVVFALAIKFIVMVLGLCGYANMWLAVFADTGVAMICILNSIRLLYSRK